MHKKLKQIFSYPVLNLNETHFNNTYKPSNKMVCNNTVIGLENEIENVHVISNAYQDFYTKTTDGSLRNNGLEFVSHPIKAKWVPQALDNLFCSIHSKAEYTSRTSIHVHMNVRTFTTEELKTLIYLYFICEPIFFSFVKPERKENIYCVPLIECPYLQITDQFFYDGATNWTKYTAFNVLPVSSKGTVEFRHLHGTNNKEEIINWVNLILYLKLYVKKNSLDKLLQHILEIENSSEYLGFLSTVFPEHIIEKTRHIFILEINKYIRHIKTLVYETLIKQRFKKEGFTDYAKIKNPTIKPLNTIWLDHVSNLSDQQSPTITPSEQDFIIESNTFNDDIGN